MRFPLVFGQCSRICCFAGFSVLGLSAFAAGQQSQIVETLPNSAVQITMLPIPGGKVSIGGKELEVKPFHMASTETAWEVYDRFLASGPPSRPYDQTPFGPEVIARPSKSYILPDLGWGHHGYPVINVSSTSVEMFCRWLASVTGKKYRLPTEAEWQWACSGGASVESKPSKSGIDKVAWYADNSGGMTHPIGKKQANKFGLFDILGNVGEWATDLEGKPVLCGSSFRSELAQVSPLTRAYFDPSWQATDPQLPKSRWWLADAPFCGFRVVLEQ